MLINYDATKLEVKSELKLKIDCYLQKRPIIVNEYSNRADIWKKECMILLETDFHTGIHTHAIIFCLHCAVGSSLIIA